MKKFTMLLSAILILTILSACSLGKVISFEVPVKSDINTAENSQQFSCVKVYSTVDKTLINTIEDKETLKQLNTALALNLDTDDYMDKKGEIAQMLEEHESLYSMVFFKTPVAIYNDGNLEKIFKITIYKDTNVILMQISPDTIKSFPIPSKFLTFYYEITDEVMDFLISLTGNGETIAMRSNQVSTAENQQDKASYHIGNPRIEKVEIYSTDGLIKTIENPEICNEFQNKSAGSVEHYNKDEFNNVLADLEEAYRFVAYKKSMFMFGKPQYEEIFELTIYRNSKVMKMYTPQEAIPISFIKLSEKNRTFVYESSDDALEYLYSITSEL